MQNFVDGLGINPLPFALPNLSCEVRYADIPKDHAPDVELCCIECGMPLLSKHMGHFLHYQLLRFD